MRIPASAIAMSVVVAVPFALGIKQTVDRTDAMSRLEDERAREHERTVAAEAEADARRAREREDERARDARRATAFRALLGDTKATLGAQLGAQVGDPAPPSWEAKLASVDGLEARDYERPGTELTGDNVIASVSFTIGDDHCEQLKTIARDLWGPPDDQHAGIWLDREHHRRASIHGLLCTLRFDRVIDDAAWAKLAVSPLVGKSVAAATKLLGTPTSGLTDEARISWYLPGPLLGHSQSELIATIDQDKIVGFELGADVTSEQGYALAIALARQLKEEPEQESAIWTWPKRGVSASYENHHFEVAVDR